ncbi:MAG: topoisomerase DNA-binding C4 zinc finger domain-containing protein, partial [bacterium]
CPKCGADIAIQNGRYGAFFACTKYPECDWRSSISPRQPASEPEELDENCPECGKKLLLKYGRHGKFIACTGFPECRYTRSLKQDEEKREVTYSDTPCPKCQGKMVLRRSKSGRFWGCENFPKCDGILPYTTGVKCPREGCEGEFVERRTRRGKLFWGCSKYPECSEISWTYPGKKEGESAEKPKESSPAEGDLIRKDEREDVGSDNKE